MNKKRELVNTILENMKKANVKLPEGQGPMLDENVHLWGENSDRYWCYYPEGHCRADNNCIEQLLACLDEHSLEDILAVGDIPDGILWGELWKMWGAAGCFSTAPTVLSVGNGTPVLRIRHDSYLSWFRGVSFQNSFDAYCNGSNGESGSGLDAAMRYVSYTPLDENGDSVEEEHWNQENAVFRKALILGYPCAAAGRLNSFHRVLKNHSEVFDEFINKTDAEVMHLGLDAVLSWKELQKQTAQVSLDGPVLAEAVLVHEEDKLCMVLKYRASGVELSWSALGEHKSLAVKMPVHQSGTGLDSIGWYYMYTCWVMLTSTLLTLAGVMFSPYWWAPTKELAGTMDDVPAGVFDGKLKATSLREVWDCLYEVTKVTFGK